MQAIKECTVCREKSIKNLIKVNLLLLSPCAYNSKQYQQWNTHSPKHLLFDLVLNLCLHPGWVGWLSLPQCSDNCAALRFAKGSSQLPSSQGIRGWRFCFNCIPVQPLPLLYGTSLPVLQKLSLRAQLNKPPACKTVSQSVSQRIWHKTNNWYMITQLVHFSTRAQALARVPAVHP